MNDRRNFFEKLGRSLKLEDEQYPQVDLTEQDFLNQDEEAMPQEEEVVEENPAPQQPAPAEEPLAPTEETLPQEEEAPVTEEGTVSASLASMSLARKRVAEKAPARKTPARKSKPSVRTGTEGRLTIDVYETDKDIVIKSTVAGVDPSELDINITPDSISIRGERTQEENVSSDSYFYQECFWGSFSRSIILPTEIDPDKAKASLKKGVLTIRLPKLSRSEERKLVIDAE